MLSYYGKLSSAFYDLDKYIGKSFGDVEYYENRLKDVRGKVLEPAVGNGRVLIPLLEKGIDISGFDLSDDMLAFCRAHLEERKLKADVSKMDMSTFELDEQFEAIILPAGSFLLLHDREQSISALKCFYRHLEAGGRLIIDLDLPGDFQTGSIFKRLIKCGENESITIEGTLVNVDFVNQVKYSHHKYEKWKNDKLVDTELEVFPLRWYGVEEMVLILKQIGFKEVVISADYEYGTYPVSANQVITYEATK
ncbi:class I SAM-dependent methyltransferase [Jeotgalibacillus sp. R-1-5s-1]|nr:class I SAM-dependent methyltransferase [Jeotgalibacillus sp. R-1-5s-1]TFD94404.1 class I SAM-dependent methyltransferase [Jeotgalibacillus sp. R-1-5s-1]